MAKIVDLTGLLGNQIPRDVQASQYELRGPVRRWTGNNLLDYDVLIEERKPSQAGKQIALIGQEPLRAYHVLMKYVGFEGNARQNMGILWTFHEEDGWMSVQGQQDPSEVKFPNRYYSNNQKSMFLNVGPMYPTKDNAHPNLNPFELALVRPELRVGLAKIAGLQLETRKQ